MSYTEAFTHKRFYTQMLLHTLAQKYLIELLMWSASGVHKQSPKVCQAKVGWQDRKTNKDEFFLCPCNKQLFHLTKSAIIQIAKTVQWVETCWHWSSEEGPDATEKTTCRFLAWPVAINEKLKWCFRYVTRRPWWYPRIIWGASLDGASYVLSIPCNYNANSMKHETQPSTKQGSFTSMQMVHTHASLPRGFCSGSQAVKAIIRSLKRKWLQNTGKNHQLN